MLEFQGDELFEKHKKLVDLDNAKISGIFEVLVMFCTGMLLVIGLVRKEYGSMNLVYLIYFFLSLGLFLFTKFYCFRHLQWSSVITVIVVLMAYSYSVLSGIVFNLHSPSITVYAVMVAACSAYMIPYRFAVFFHSILGVVYCSLALLFKPEYGVQDTVNYTIFLVMTFALTYIVQKSRKGFLYSIDQAIEQKAIAEEKERLERELRISASNLYDESKQREKLNQALELAEQANQAKTDFLSRVSHDMRTPLNGILGLTMLLKEKAEDKDTLRDLTQLELSGQYLLNLINDTLDVSKIESGRLELHPVVCDGRDVLNNVMALAKPNLQAKKIQLHVHADDLPFTMLYIDVGRVEQIMMNILGNAIKFTPEGGSIDFIMRNLSVDDGFIVDEVIIKDNGIGMSPEFLPKLFEPFSQENHGRTSSHQGTGLGMTITKQIIELMGGEIRVESEIGKGTQFIFTLTMQIASEERIHEWRNNKIEECRDHILEGKRILLCEDHPLNANIVKRLLDDKGVLVEHAENGKIGVEMFQASEPFYYDVVLMDIRMPVLDGIDATRRIRALTREDARQIPIVALTANAFDEDVQQVKEAGMDAHLRKPIETDKFFHTLENTLCINRNETKPVILVVDDIEMNRAVVCETLRNDYVLYEAENGKRAMEILERHKRIDVVITDIQMPEMNGIQLIQNIRANEKYRHMVIIANTQFGDAKQEEELLAMGADEFVYKPSTPKMLKIRVRNLLK